MSAAKRYEVVSPSGEVLFTGNAKDCGDFAGLVGLWVKGPFTLRAAVGLAGKDTPQ